LDGLARRDRRLAPEIAVHIAIQTLAGLHAAHELKDTDGSNLGVVHRDVSPQNVLLSLEGEVKVTDFGIAKARGALEPPSDDTRSRQLHGKFGYMSPEQARGENVDARSDLFSLGVLLYECVAGVNPFSAPTTFETLRRVQAGEAPPVELLRPDAPPELVTIVQTAMAKDINVRYADAGRMYEAMLAFLYAQGSRYSAHDLAEFLGRFRDAEPVASLSPDRLLDPDHNVPVTAERTPVEIPPSRMTPPTSGQTPRGEPRLQDTGVRFVGIDRAASMDERREVTALAIDFSDGNSDALIERASTIIGRYGGKLLPREPHQLIALFGLGDPDGRDTEVATRCALVALRSMGGATPPSAGIHTARIHVARDGEPTEDERLSSLLSTAGDFARVRPGRCAVSAPAMRQLRGLFDFEPIADANPSRPLSGSIVKDVRGAGEAFGRFVGRKDELRKLGEILAAATKRSARVITIRGDHGVGKTRLLVEVERRLGKGGYNVGWYVATCPPRGREFPLSGIVCMLQILCGLTEGDSAERILAVQPRLRALGLHDEDVAAILSALGAAVPAPNANAKTALKNAFTRMVASLCEDKPHTFTWDAAHCMDEDSFALVEGAFGRLTQARVVFGFSARAGFSHALESSPGHGLLELADLSPADAEGLIAARLGVLKAPDELVRFVRDRAGGHPQFIEEVLKGLLDADAVKTADKQVVSMKLVGQELALPKTLRGLVASRVSRLTPADRATLQAAAVLGDPVDAAVLAQMLEQPMSALEGSLAELKTRELLMHTGPSELRFTSPIIREVVVDALTLEASREIHAAAGNALETVLGDKAVEHAARIATHLYEAGDRERAAEYFARSGERRLEGRQLEAAARDYARALDLSDVSHKDPGVLAEWLGGLTNAVRLVRSLPEAVDICERVLTRIDAAGDAALRVRTRVDAGVMLCALHKFDVARVHFAEAERVADGDGPLSKTILLAYAELASRQGDFNR
ncbi:MAG: protein kinase, partial [Polyangiaceae bacterium]